MTTVTGTGHGTAATTAAGTVTGYAPAAVSGPDGHGAGRHAAAVSTVVDTAGTLDTDTDTAGGPGTDTAVDTDTDTGRGSVPVSVSVTKPGRRRFLIFGPRRTRLVGHVTMPVSMSVSTVSAATTGPTPATMPSTGWRSYRTLLTAVVAVVASIGQVQFARRVHFTHMIELPGVFDLTPWLAVAVFDLSVATLLDAGRRVIPTKLSPWPFWAAAAGIAGLSVWTNARHEGAWITAPASGVLFVTWFVALLYEYRLWRMNEGHLVGTSPNLLTSRLFLIRPALAYRAWVIASTRPLARCLTYRAGQGDTGLTVRDLAVISARLFHDVHTDRIAVELAQVSVWQRRLRRAARNRALMTATDNLDVFLGLPVIRREGVVVSQVGYVQPEPPPAPPVRQQPDEPPMTEWVREVATARTTRQATMSAAPTSPAPAGVPDVPDVDTAWLDTHAARIGLVQRVTGDGWWNAAKPLSVDAVQALGREHGEGLANRTNAKETAACLRRLRALRLVDELAADAPTTGRSPEGDD